MSAREGPVTLAGGRKPLMMHLADALELADNHGLLGEHEPHYTDGFDSAGFTGETHVDTAMNHNCMLSIGFGMMAEGDDCYA